MTWLKSFSGKFYINSSHIAKIELDENRIVAHLPMNMGDEDCENYEVHPLYKGANNEEAKVIFQRIQYMLDVQDY